jgi:hypothetical protein
MRMPEPESDPPLRSAPEVLRLAAELLL